MKFICAQPAIPYYSWQVEIVINNFIRNGINPNDIHIVCAKYGNVIDEWVKLKEHYTDVNFFFYDDTRKKPSYTSSIRPNILHQHWLANPYLENEVIFYHDCDIVFTKPVDFSKFIYDDICYLSDTVSYIGANYIRSKSEDYLDLMTKIVNIDKNKVIAEEANSGGAQYILKNIPAEFWNKVYYDCETMYRIIVDKQNGDPSNPFQIWCSDMWAVLWNLWFFDKTVRVVPELNFAWATSGIQDWDTHLIYHNAGVVDEKHNLFFKGGYINKLPYINIVENTFSHNHCSYNYVNELLKTKEVSCLV